MSKISRKSGFFPDANKVQPHSSTAPAPAPALPAPAPVATTFEASDPLYSSQWHFGMIGRLGYQASADTTGIERIWDEYTGAGVSVGIWDSGVQTAHWDLQANYDASKHVTIEGTLNNGEPADLTERHGTAVAGLIAAENNGVGGVGVAFDASITSIRIFGGADDINDHWDRYLVTLDSLKNFDVTNHSYGAYPDFNYWTGYTGDVAKFQAAAEEGRGGLGTVNVKSAGNDNVDGNGEELSASRFTVSVAAIGDNATGNPAWYSTYGAHILVAAPAGSVTTDLLGNGAGYDGLLDGDYTNGFSGTSAAGPITAGVVALMLDANPGLGWRDVQNILAYSATGTGSLYTGVTTYENSEWKWNSADDWNGGGLHFSEDYGYGMVNAFNAVRMAEVWSILHPVAATSANEQSVSTGTLAVDQAISYDLAPIEYSFEVEEGVSLEHVSLTVSLTHTYLDEVNIRLIAPDGTATTILDGSNLSARFFAAEGLTYTFGLDGFRGVSSAGTWTLEVWDAYDGDDGTLHSVEFTGFGSSAGSDDVYTYTDEVLTVLAQPGQAGRLTLQDADAGKDWINAAAMHGNLVLDLNPGMGSTLDGNAFLNVESLTELENAIAGDGNDRIVGTAKDNVLYGMRGVDTIEGGWGQDVLHGGEGNDVLRGGLGLDKMYGGPDDDTYYVDNIGDVVGEQSGDGVDHVFVDYPFKPGATYVLPANVENLTLGNSPMPALPYAVNGTGNGLDNVITGGGSANRLAGAGGADTLIGGLGADSFVYLASSDSGTVPGTWDVIQDFNRLQRDKIDLGLMDANAELIGNQAFVFIGTASFGTNAKGQLRFDSANHMLYGSTDRDADAEFAIELVGVTSLVAADIVL